MDCKYLGFTLLELLIAFSILSIIIITLSYNFINLIDSLNLEEATINLFTTLKLFHENASSQKDYYDLFEFYPTIELCIWKVYNSSSNSYKVYKIIDLNKYKVDLISANFGTLNILHFTSLGIPSSGGTIVLGKGKLRKYIIITPATGRIWISDLPPENW
ncbi:MAG: prepilin-type N-terminal cleavage/methylation domain-containing protein [Dictyoglomaceae bacterium]|nr:prepilin-type N-terminal cleavage/methylation domain-containing protein [Dictyoglomaceae bacterium]